MITFDVQNCDQELNTLLLRKEKEAQVAVSRDKTRERKIETFCFIIREFSIFLCCFQQ